MANANETWPICLRILPDTYNYCRFSTWRHHRRNSLYCERWRATTHCSYCPPMGVACRVDAHVLTGRMIRRTYLWHSPALSRSGDVGSGGARRGGMGLSTAPPGRGITLALRLHRFAPIRWPSISLEVWCSNAPHDKGRPVTAATYFWPIIPTTAGTGRVLCGTVNPRRSAAAIARSVWRNEQFRSRTPRYLPVDRRRAG